MKAFLSLLLAIMPFLAMAQSDEPTFDPTGTYYKIDADGKEESGDVSGTVQSAPIRVVFAANGTNTEGHNVRYAWKIFNSLAPAAPVMIGKNTEDVIEYTFNMSGSFTAQLEVTYTNEYGEDVDYPGEGEEPKTITFSVSESKLEFPNAFSPNGDGTNDTLRPKDGFQSIVSFEAAVFNRWGNKLYSWSDVNGEWDGKYNGRTVKDGVYFLVVKAKGADGRNFNYKKTITVLTGYNRGEGSATGNE